MFLAAGLVIEKVSGVVGIVYTKAITQAVGNEPIRNER